MSSTLLPLDADSTAAAACSNRSKAETDLEVAAVCVATVTLGHLMAVSFADMVTGCLASFARDEPLLQLPRSGDGNVHRPGEQSSTNKQLCCIGFVARSIV